LHLFGRVYNLGATPPLSLDDGRAKFGEAVPVVVDGEVTAGDSSGSPTPTVLLVKTRDGYLVYALSGAP
jgi:hypothetical protein